MTTVNDDLIRAFLADEARRAVTAAPSLDQAIRRLARGLEGRPSGASRRLIALVAAALLLVAALGTAIAVGSGILRPPLVIDDPPDLGIFEPVAGRILYADRSGMWSVDPAVPADPATNVELSSEGLRLIPLGWSSDGTRLLAMRQHGPAALATSDVFIIHRDGSEARVTERPVQIRGAAISPDGSRVAYTAIPETPGADSPWGLYVVDADGGPAELLVESRNGILDELAFSPDGTQIAYSDGAGDNNHHIWVMDADGSDAHEILTRDCACHVYGLAWSPAGDRIALGIEGSVYTFAPDGSQFTRVITNGDRPYWSPDGSKIAYTVSCQEDADGCGLAIADADGSNVRELGSGASGPWHPVGGTQSDEEADQSRAAQLVLDFQSWSPRAAEANRTAVLIYADGRVIWNGGEQADYVELQLTPEGIEQLRSMVVSTRLFEHDLALGLDLDTGVLEAFRGDQSVTVVWGRTPAALLGLDDNHRFAEATLAQAGELTELEAFLRDPAAWALPPEMYRQSEITPFLATHVWVGYDRSVPDFSTLASPAREIVTGHLEGAINGGCGIISIDQAREVVDALVQAELMEPVDDVRRGFTFDLGRSFVHIHPSLPHEVDCA